MTVERKSKHRHAGNVMTKDLIVRQANGSTARRKGAEHTTAAEEEKKKENTKGSAQDPNDLSLASRLEISPVENPVCNFARSRSNNII